MDSTYRKERIERLLKELKYEIMRGMMEREIDETIGFRFVVPVSQTIPNGVVACEFHTRPVPHSEVDPFYFAKVAPNIRLVSP